MKNMKIDRNVYSVKEKTKNKRTNNNKKKKPTPINSKANYRREMKLVPINNDYYQLQLYPLNFFLGFCAKFLIKARKWFFFFFFCLEKKYY